jgi:hypothetical protein
MIRNSLRTSVAALAMALLTGYLGAAPAMADILSNLELTATPQFTTATNAGACKTTPGAAIPPANGPVCTITDDLRLNYGLNYKFSQQWGLYYTHENVNYTIDSGSIIPTPTGIAHLPISDIDDRADTIGLNYNALAKHGLTLNGGYYGYAREVGGNNPAGGPDSTAASTAGGGQGHIGFHGYFVGGSYNFGPHSVYGSLLTLDARLLYSIHPDTLANQLSNDTGAVIPGAGFVQQVAYGGNRFIPTGGLTLHLPIGNKQLLFPFVGISKAAVYYFNDPGPEFFNVTYAGVAKVISKDLSLVGSWTNLDEQHFSYPIGIPFGPNDPYRLTTVQLKLEYKIHA